MGVVAGLVPASPSFNAQRKTIGMAGTSPATTRETYCGGMATTA
jgi:hypothetical protein